MTPRDYSEDEVVERPTLELLESLGYEVEDGYAETLGPEGLGRDDRSQVALRHRLAPKLAELNPDLPAAAIEVAVEELTHDRSTLERTRANREVHQLLRNGVTVTYADEDGGRSTETVRVIDWTVPANNEFLAVRQLWVVGPLHTRRCDIVCFVNGIPLVLLELKASHKSVEQAYRNNLRDYRDTIPQLFTPNAFVVLSTGSETKIGATFAPWERFGEWKRLDDEAESGVVSLETAIHGLCEGVVTPALRGGTADCARGPVGARAGRVRPDDQARSGADRRGAQWGEEGRAKADGAHPGPACLGLATQGAYA